MRGELSGCCDVKCGEEAQENEEFGCGEVWGGGERWGSGNGQEEGDVNHVYGLSVAPRCVWHAGDGGAHKQRPDSTLITGDNPACRRTDKEGGGAGVAGDALFSYQRHHPSPLHHSPSSQRLGEYHRGLLPVSPPRSVCLEKWSLL